MNYRTVYRALVAVPLFAASLFVGSAMAQAPASRSFHTGAVVLR
jgi:hypothetical protein